MKVSKAAMILAFFTISTKDKFSVDKVNAFNSRKHLNRLMSKFWNLESTVRSVELIHF